MSDKLPKCALVIGHSRKSPGAKNKKSGMTEFDFNQELALAIVSKVQSNNTLTVITERETYKDLPDKINRQNPDFIISLHCNAFDERANGCEVLYYHKSKRARRIAQVLEDNILVNVRGLKERGCKPVDSEGRGGYLLKHTAAPCVIAEPFFIDNDQEYEYVQARKNSLVQAYVDTIHYISGSLTSGDPL